MIPSLTHSEIRRAFPWVPNFRSILRAFRPEPIRGSHILVGSDYSGAHKNSNYLVYSFILVDADESREWPSLRSAVRVKYLSDGRRMSFKHLNDAQRQRALLPFLGAANSFSGICFAVVVHKDLNRMSTSPNSVDVWRSLRGLKGNWRPHAFEAMARIVHFFCLFVAEFSRPLQHVTWITDEDEIVANEDRLDDTMDFASKMIGLYIGHSLGEFAMNSTQIDPGDRGIEDFVAIPDLIAGTFAEIVTALSSDPHWQDGGELTIDPDLLTEKANIINDWFWATPSTFKRTVILIDRYDNERFRVKHLDICR